MFGRFPLTRKVAWLPALLLAMSLAPVSAHADGASLELSSDEAPVGARLHVHGTGFVNFSLITNNLDIVVFNADTEIVEEGSIPADADGTIDADIDTSDGKYAPGSYSVMASYTYWGARRDAYNRVVCDFCPVKTVPLADTVSFTLR